jgi:hypothetical protein
MPVAFNASFRIVTFGLRSNPYMSYATILPTVERQVRGHMRNRQETVKPDGKRGSRLPWA